jgi:aminoglycoside phosphotransferase (APT) family kinase protein
VPVASVIAAGEDDAVLGPAWTVVERLPGTADPRAILAGDGVPDAERVLDDLARALAAVHRMDVDDTAVPRVSDPLADLRAMHDELSQPHPVFELAFRELAAGSPAASRTCLVHGDFRMGNVLVGPDGVTAVLDWELTHVGDPLEDLGWLCVPAWRFGRPDRPAAGLGSREDLAAAYERDAGVAVDGDAMRWWELFGTLKWGVICVVQAFTHLSGAARSLEHAVIGRRACEVEWDLLEALDPGGAGRAIDAQIEQPAPALHDRPTAPELLDAARGALGDQVLPLLEQRAAFQLRVALRALGMVERELRHGAEHSAVHAAALSTLGVADEPALAAAVRSGAFDERRNDLLTALRAIVRAKLQAANPRYLKEVARDT